jgi:hypothetical protein
MQEITIMLEIDGVEIHVDEVKKNVYRIAGRIFQANEIKKDILKRIRKDIKFFREVLS